MKLPGINKEVSIEEIMVICDYYGRDELWTKIAANPPKRPFKSDGCSMWFDSWGDVDFYAECFLHDIEYWAGYPGEEVERLCADARLMMGIAKKFNDVKMAETMFAGVRAGGDGIFAKIFGAKTFAWGYGRI